MGMGTVDNKQVSTAGLPGLKLPFQFEPARLKQDLALIAADEWTPHYNERDFGGQWTGVSLRSAAGSQRDLNAGPPGNAHFTDTPLLARCPYFREVLVGLQCPLKSVRLLALAPGSFIREHSDQALGYDDGEIRIHIPIQTNPGVEFYVCGERLLLEEGQCYYINVNLPHRVNNRGDAARIHLVIDAEVNDWVRSLFERFMDNDAKIPRSSLPPGGFDEYVDLVFADKILREKLRAIPDRAGLLRVAVQEATAHGFDLNEADLESAFRSQSSAGARNTIGWTPIDISLRESRPWAKWIYAPGNRFTEPFFEDSVRVCRRNPFVALFQREMPLTAGPRVRPAGFIFHMSRCGSTLVSRCLAAAESTLVMAEPAPLDQIVQANNPEWLDWIVSALGGARTEKQTHYLIKADSWHVRSLSLFRAVFPDVPWIFVYRDPLEVLVSLLRQPGRQASPGLMDSAILGLRAEDVRTLTRQQWCARVLEGFMAAALAFREDPKGMFVSYRELPGAICGRIAEHFGLRLDTEDEARVQSVAVLDAKNPAFTFERDSEAKQFQGQSLQSDPILGALQSLYQRLESTR